MKKSVVWLVLIVLLLAPVVYALNAPPPPPPPPPENGGGQGTANQQAVDVEISIGDFVFTPQEVTINLGQVVAWTNNHNVIHQIVLDDGSFDSGILNVGARSVKQFNSAGVFTYKCGVHPEMTGTITVVDPNAPPPPPANGGNEEGEAQEENNNGQNNDNNQNNGAQGGAPPPPPPPPPENGGEENQNNNGGNDGGNQNDNNDQNDGNNGAQAPPAPPPPPPPENPDAGNDDLNNNDGGNDQGNNNGDDNNNNNANNGGAPPGPPPPPPPENPNAGNEDNVNNNNAGANNQGGGNAVPQNNGVPSGGSGSTSSGGSGIPRISLGSTGTTLELRVSRTYNLNAAGVTKSFRINSVNGNQISATVGGQQTVTMDVGESKQFDLNNDGISDINANFLRLNNARPVFSFLPISGTATSTQQNNGAPSGGSGSSGSSSQANSQGFLPQAGTQNSVPSIPTGSQNTQGLSERTPAGQTETVSQNTIGDGLGNLLAGNLPDVPYFGLVVWTTVGILIIGAIAGIATAVVVRKRAHSHPPESIENYIRMTLNRGYRLQAVKSALEKQGWKKDVIEEAVKDVMSPTPPKL